MAADYYDILQPFNHIYGMLDDNKATLGLRYIARHDEDLIPQYPAALIQTDLTNRELHATQEFLVEWGLDLWIFHAEMSTDTATRSEKDIALATDVRKLLHTDRTLGGHIIFGFVNGEFPGVSVRVIQTNTVTTITTRLTWIGQNVVKFEDS